MVLVLECGARVGAWMVHGQVLVLGQVFGWYMDRCWCAWTGAWMVHGQVLVCLDRCLDGTGA
ncbi:hypothetical protein D3C71_2166480 [compost metagenome]